MIITPESIKSNETLAYELTFKDRLAKLDLSQMIIDIETESNADKLQLLYDMFNIDGNFFNVLILTPIERRNLLVKMIDIMRHSGTNYSISEMAKLLGATSVSITNNYWQLRHNGEARRNGYHNRTPQYFKPFALEIYVFGILLIDRPAFEANFRILFTQLQPIRVDWYKLTFI